MTRAPFQEGSAERHALALVIVAIVVGRLGTDSHPRHLPFIEMLDSVGSPYQWQMLLDALWWCGALLVATPYFRMGALIAGAVELLRVLGNMPQFSNGRTFDGLLLLLVALSSDATGNRLLRWQYVLLYAGATLSKLFDSDWYNGAFVTATLTDSAPGRLLSQVPGLPTVAGIFTILTEASIPVLLVSSRFRRFGVWLCLCFHTSLLVVLREDFATFYYTVAAGAVLLFYPFPTVERLRMPSRWLAQLLPWSALSVVRAVRPESGAWSMLWGGSMLRGWRVPATIVLTSLPGLGVLVFALTTVARLGFYDAREIIVGGSVLFFGVLTLRHHLLLRLRT